MIQRERDGTQLVNEFINDVNEDVALQNSSEKEVLRTVKFGDVADTAPNKECPIFQTEFQESQLVTQLPCKHCFEPDAIKHWLSTEKAECPICRYELPSKEIKDENKDDRVSFYATTHNVDIDPEEEELRLALLASMDDYHSAQS